MRTTAKYLFPSQRAARGLWVVGRPLRPLSSAFLMLASLLFRAVPATAAGPDATPEARRARLDVVYSGSLFRTVSRNDAIAVTRAWVDTVGKQKGFDLDCSVTVAEDLTELSSKLRVLAEISPLFEGILCARERPVTYREESMEALRELHQDAAGRQILVVFRSERLRPVNSASLARVRTLCATYRRISAQTASSKTVAPRAKP
jgi:hypothetical protein